jgi:selenide,water dikinase
MPIDRLPVEIIGRILEGGESVCAAAGIPIAGGHTIDSVEPIYGLVVLGLVHPKKIKKNSGARAGDQLVLGKPLGVGVLSAALKKEQLSPQGYAAMIASTTKLNTPGRLLADLDGVHALTDITGFGLLGHTLEIARGARLTARLSWPKLPLIEGVRELAEQGFVTGVSGRNWAGYGRDVRLAPGIGDIERALLTDPQTSGGLLVTCRPDTVDEVLSIFRREGFERAAVVGDLVAGEPRVEVAA